ncbi:MAG TPA: S53 family peptidase [Bryobacteraceae bacterium]|nr:S53 family peptidase [Bryobacteraceae bacterium]
MSSRSHLRFVAILCAAPVALLAQTGRAPRRLVTTPIDEGSLHRLAGNTRPEANAQNDLGAVEDTFAMDHMLLQLQRPAETESAAAAAIDAMHNPKSATYHKWMTAAQFGAAYGPAQSDIDAVTNWLKGQGFTVNSVYPSHMTVDFSGNAGQVRQGFHTEVHHLNVHGQSHVANIRDPQVPTALAGIIRGVASMHDFKARPMKSARAKYTYTSQGYQTWALTPADLATIYNFTPLFNAGYSGAGQTIAVIEDARLYNTADWDTFRSTFGLSQYTGGSLTLVQPTASGSVACGAPGTANGDDGEATLDAEWASASAPSATIEVAACASTRTTDGAVIALVNLINSDNPPPIISISYGICEAQNGAAANALFNAAYQQATAEGISVFVAAGDEGAAACDAGEDGATHGLGVSAWASTPYNVAVGGTDFSDTYNSSNSTYWGNTNSSTYGSAVSYIPEIPWNDSCASQLLASALGFSATYGSSGLCGSSAAQQYSLLSVEAGSGGPSACATGSPDSDGIVGGSCQGFAKPSWQSGLAGIPSDGVRDIPDVSLFAGTGIWGHYYVMCFSDLRNDGAACTGDPSGWAGAGGTSFSAPIMAGIQALVNQKTNSAQGNPNYVYYQMAAGSATCDATNGDSGACIFHNVTQGDIDVNCSGSQNCYGASASTSGGGGRRRGGGGGGGAEANGALSGSSNTYSPAFAAAPGWNFATGIGSVNAANLVNNWPTASAGANNN